MLMDIPRGPPPQGPPPGVPHAPPLLGCCAESSLWVSGTCCCCRWWVFPLAHMNNAVPTQMAGGQPTLMSSACFPASWAILPHFAPHLCTIAFCRARSALDCPKQQTTDTNAVRMHLQWHLHCDQRCRRQYQGSIVEVPIGYFRLLMVHALPRCCSHKIAQKSPGTVSWASMPQWAPTREYVCARPRPSPEATATPASPVPLVTPSPCISSPPSPCPNSGLPDKEDYEDYSPPPAPPPAASTWPSPAAPAWPSTWTPTWSRVPYLPQILFSHHRGPAGWMETCL